MFGDRRGSRAVEPELLARFRADRDKTFAATRDCRCAPLPSAACATAFSSSPTMSPNNTILGSRRAWIWWYNPRLLQIALVQMFQTGQHRAALAGLGVEVILDFDDRRHRIAHLAEKFQADRAGMLGHFVQNPARRGDHAVAAFFLDARQARQELVGDILAQALLAECAPGISRISVLNTAPSCLFRRG